MLNDLKVKLMILDGEKFDSRGSFFKFLNYLGKNGFEDALVAEEKSDIYRKIITLFPVSLDLMLVYESPEVVVLNANKYEAELGARKDEFINFFKGQIFYMYINTFPKKHLLAVDSVGLAKIISSDLFSFEHFICDADFTCFLTETSEGMILSSGRFAEFFCDARRGEQ